MNKYAIYLVVSMSCVILLYPQNSIQKAGKTVGMGRMVEGKRKGKGKGEDGGGEGAGGGE